MTKVQSTRQPRDTQKWNDTHGHGKLYRTAVEKRQKPGRIAGEPVVSVAGRQKAPRLRTSASDSQRGDTTGVHGHTADHPRGTAQVQTN